MKFNKLFQRSFTYWLH